MSDLARRYPLGVPVGGRDVNATARNSPAPVSIPNRPGWFRLSNGKEVFIDTPIPVPIPCKATPL